MILIKERPQLLAEEIAETEASLYEAHPFTRQ